MLNGAEQHTLVRKFSSAIFKAKPSELVAEASAPEPTFESRNKHGLTIYKPPQHNDYATPLAKAIEDDHFGRWLEKYERVDAALGTQLSKLFESWCHYALENGVSATSAEELAERLALMGVQSLSRDGETWLGIILQESANDAQERETLQHSLRREMLAATAALLRAAIDELPEEQRAICEAHLAAYDADVKPPTELELAARYGVSKNTISSRWRLAKATIHRSLARRLCPDGGDPWRALFPLIRQEKDGTIVRTFLDANTDTQEIWTEHQARDNRQVGRSELHDQKEAHATHLERGAFVRGERSVPLDFSQPGNWAGPESSGPEIEVVDACIEKAACRASTSSMPAKYQQIADAEREAEARRLARLWASAYRSGESLEDQAIREGATVPEATALAEYVRAELPGNDEDERLAENRSDLLSKLAIKRYLDASRPRLALITKTLKEVAAVFRAHGPPEYTRHEIPSFKPVGDIRVNGVRAGSGGWEVPSRRSL